MSPTRKRDREFFGRFYSSSYTLLMTTKKTIKKAICKKKKKETKRKTLEPSKSERIFFPGKYSSNVLIFFFATGDFWSLAVLVGATKLFFPFG